VADHTPKPIAGVLRTTLSNGLRVAIIRAPLAPVAAVEVNYLVGSNESPEGFPGMAHALEHMMFRGSAGLTAGQLYYLYAAMGEMANAETQSGVTRYYSTVPTEDLDIVLNIEAIRMRDILNSNSLWDEERGAIKQEVAQELSKPEYVLYTKLLQGLFTGTPRAHDSLGTLASFDKITTAMLRAFYNAWYRPNNAVLVVAGDVQPRKVLDKIKRLFGSIPARKLPQRPPIRLQPVRAQTLELKTQRANGKVVIAFRLPGYESPHYPAAQLLADALNSKRGDLFDLVVAGQALSTSFNMEAISEAGFAYAEAEFPQGADAAELVRQIQSILKRYAKNGLPKGLVEAAKRRAVTEIELEKNSVAGIAQDWAQVLAGEGESPQDDIEAMKRVSVADVNRIARKYLDTPHQIVAIITPEPAAESVSSRPLKRPTLLKESPARGQMRVSAPPEWAQKMLRAEPIPDSSVHPVDMTLPNGLRLIVQPQSISDTVSVYGRIRTEPDLQIPEGQEGVDRVLSGLFTFGTETRDRVAFLRALDAIGIDIAVGTHFSVRALSRYFDRAVQLLADNQLRPALDEAAFKIVREQVAATVGGKLQSPDYLAQRALAMALLPKGDSRLRQATPQTVAALTLQNVKDYYRRVFRPDLTTIVVIGKVTPQQAKAVIEKYFGAWKAAGPRPQTDLPPVPLNPASFVAIPDKSRVQSTVFLAQMLGINRFSPDYYALELGNRLLGDGFYAARLSHNLRETGLVYHIASDIKATRTRTTYLVEYACDPANVSKARAIVERDLEDMQVTPVSEDVLRQAKDSVLREIALSEASVAEIAEGLLDRATLGLPLDEPMLAARRYAMLSALDIREAFERWLRLQDLVQVTQGPLPQ
jgi:zinc protease